MKDRIILHSVVYLYFIVIVTILLFWAVLREAVELRGNYDIAVVASFVAIGLFGVIFLAQAVLRCGISLCVIHWYFVLIFFFIVPFLQYLGNLFLHRVESDGILIGNIYILLWCLLYGFAYNYSIRKVSATSGALSLFSGQGLRPDVLKLRFYALTLASVGVAVWLISVGGIESFLTRGSYGLFVERVGGWKSWGFVITFYLRPLLFFILVLFIGVVFLFKKVRKTPAIHLCLFALIVTNMIVNNPISYAKFMLFTVAFGLFVLFSLRRVKSSLVYISALFLGLPIAFILDVFRRSYADLSREEAPKFYWGFVFRGSLDSYENFIHTISHVSQSGIVYGKQLAGALLFFVPRAFWTDKPVGSGAYIAEFLERKFEVTNFNIGNPLISEMYLNFHIIGIVAGALLYGAVTGRLDKHYWLSLEKDASCRSRNQRNVDFYRVLYPFLLGLYLFHLRGDFMSSYAYSAAIVLAFVTVVMFLKLRVAQLT
jgi:hypothetical protein